jgi:leucyl/phenylalanyl-tRNA--protein transferase
MPRFKFPDPRFCNSADDIVAVGGDLRLETLIAAYSSGIFPWPHEDYPLLWFCPPERAILEYEALHLSRSLKRNLKKSNYRCSVNQAFSSVIEACSSSPRPGQDGTWITPDLALAYVELHRNGLAHSVEVWEEDQLVGGIYGVSIGGSFSAESMFHKKSGASKLALSFLLEQLAKESLTWIDIQVMTPHLKEMGARMISREEFLDKIVFEKTKNKGRPLNLFTGSTLE